MRLIPSQEPATFVAALTFDVDGGAIVVSVLRKVTRREPHPFSTPSSHDVEVAARYVVSPATLVQIGRNVAATLANYRRLMGAEPLTHMEIEANANAAIAGALVDSLERDLRPADSHPA